MAGIWERTDEITMGVIRAKGEEANRGRMMTRKEKAQRKWAMWKNDHHHIVDEALHSMFCEENYNYLKLYTHTTFNALRRVIDETAILYQEPAKRYLKTPSDVEGVESDEDGEFFDLLSLDDPELAQVTSAPVAAKPAAGEAAPVEEPPGETEATEDIAATPFEEYCELMDLDSLFGEVDAISTFNEAVFLMPVVRNVTDEDGTVRSVLDTDIYTPANADVVTDPNNPLNPLAFYTWHEEPIDDKGNSMVNSVVSLAKGDKQRRALFYYLWTPKLFIKLNAKWEEVPNQLQPIGHQIQGPNELGRLPVTVIRQGRATDCFYLDGKGDDLYDATVEISCMRTLENRAFLFSSIKQPVIDGDEADIPTGQVMANPAIPLRLGESAKHAVLDLSVNLQQLRETVGERREEIATNYGISPSSWTMTEKALSGFSKKMDQVKILKYNRKKRKWFVVAEKDFYRLTAKVIEVSGATDLPTLDPTADYVVDFAEPKYEEAPLEQAKSDAIDLKSNKVSIVDIIRRDNPDLTEKDAIKLLARNRLINQRFITGDENQVLDMLLNKAAAVGNKGTDPAAPKGSEA